MEEIWDEVTHPDGTVERTFRGFKPVPTEIQMWQARAILFRSGLLGMVEQAVKAATNPEIEIAWEYAPNVVRRSAFVSAMASALGLTDDQIDNLFIEGAKIK
jgi:hypothetical protein